MVECPWAEENREQRLGTVAEVLEARYGLPRHGNKINPLDELFYIILSSQTDENKYKPVYLELKSTFPTWKLIGENDLGKLEGIIQPAGLSKVKARNFISILSKIDHDFGKRSLSSLKKMSTKDAERYLCSLPGIGLKSARCILLYSLGRKVLPLDTHNFRVLKRLGVHNLPEPIRRWHNTVQDMIPEDLRFSLHVNLISLGREICTALNPKCHLCPISDYCCYFQQYNRGCGEK